MTAPPEPPPPSASASPSDSASPDRSAAPGQGLLLPDGTTVGAAEGVEDGTHDGRSPYSPMAVIARVPLPVRRITKVQVIALVLFTLISLGPILALVVILRSDTSAIPVVVSEDQITSVDGLNLSLTVTSVNAITREMGMRMTVTSSSRETTGLIQGGRMTETVDIALPAPSGSLQGNYTVTLTKGETVGAIEFVVQMSDGSIARYPYDSYESQIYIIASRPVASAGTPTGGANGSTGTSGSTGSTGSNGSTGVTTEDASTVRVPVPISVEVSADVPGFVVSGSLPQDGRSESARNILLDVRRNGPTLLYTTWIMFLWWALSVSAVFILWSVAIWRSSTPPWAYGYLVGVLFALAPLRGALPGQPPYGVLIDYVSFYWAVGTMGVGLLILVSFFVRDARQDGSSRTREEEQIQDRTEDVAYDAGDTALAIPVGTELIVEGGSEPAARPEPAATTHLQAPSNGGGDTPGATGAPGADAPRDDHASRPPTGPSGAGSTS